MSKRIARAVLAASVITAAVSLACRPRVPPLAGYAAPLITAFTHVTVVPMDREGTMPDYTVIVRSGRIAAVGTASEITVPEGATRINGRGRYLMPGLADMHVHLTTPSGLLLYLANGVTTVRNMAGRTAHLAWRDSVRAGAMLGPTIYTAGPIVDGPEPVWPGSARVDNAAEADSVVESQRGAGYDLIKVYNGLSLPAYQGVVRAARRNQMPVAGHIPRAVPLDTAIAAGQAIEHLWGMAARVLPHNPVVTVDLRALSGDELRAKQAELGRSLLAGTLAEGDFIDPSRLDSMVGEVCEAGVWNTPTLVVFERPILAGAALAEARAAPEMAFVLPQVLNSWPSTVSRPDDLPAPVARFRRAELQIRQRIVGALQRAGCGLLLGTDAPNPLIVPGFSVHRELQHLVDAGLTPFEAIVAATRAPAEFLGAKNEFGTVRLGLRADLLLLEANPLEDVRNVARRIGVMVRGQWFSETNLRERLDRLAADYAARK